MFGRRKEPAKLTGETPMRRFNLRGGAYGPLTPLSSFASQKQIDLLNTMQEHTGQPLDLYAPSALSFGPDIDMSNPQTQQMIDGLDEQIKQGIEEMGGKLALQAATDENGDLKW